MARDADGSRPLQDGPAVPAEVVFLAVMAALLAIVALAGVPLAPEPVAGDGSDALRQDWAVQQGLVQVEAPAEDALPTGRGREPVIGDR
jgi:hypothetical protein